MTTLAANTPRVYEGGDRNEIPVIASDIIWEGAAIGVVTGSGHARPLTSVDRFAGFAEAKADNSAGAAADVNVRTYESGKISMAVTGAVITDVGQPVYSTDDDTFVFLPVGAVFVGFVHRFVSAGVVIVKFDAYAFKDPYGDGVKELHSANYTINDQDQGKTLFIDTDAFTITLPAIVGAQQSIKIVNIGAYGTILVDVAPAAADLIDGPDLVGIDNTGVQNTKATAQRGDFVMITDFHANGWAVIDMRGTWVIA